VIELTIQGIFNTAMRGLQSQHWKQSRFRTEYHGGYPTYNDGAGRHCFWGWVDTSIPPGATGPLASIWAGFYESRLNGGAGGEVTKALIEQAKENINLLEFVNKGMRIHDTNHTKHDMQFAYILLLDDYRLSVPSDVDLGLGRGVGGYNEEDALEEENLGDSRAAE
jgi:hypothetical protein